MKKKFLAVLLAGAMMLSSDTAVFADDSRGSTDGNLEKQSAVFEINV